MSIRWIMDNMCAIQIALSVADFVHYSSSAGSCWWVRVWGHKTKAQPKLLRLYHHEPRLCWPLGAAGQPQGKQRSMFIISLPCFKIYYQKYNRTIEDSCFCCAVYWMARAICPKELIRLWGRKFYSEFQINQPDSLWVCCMMQIVWLLKHSVFSWSNSTVVSYASFILLMRHATIAHQDIICIRKESDFHTCLKKGPIF
jgi:hypothetical protein